MTKGIKIIGLIMFIMIGQLAFGQSDQENALKKAIKAVEFIDNGKFDEGIKLLKEAQKLDPDRIDYPYEIAYAYCLKEDYKAAIKILEKIVDHKSVTDQVFQLLGNCYDLMGKSDKAFDAYDEGLKKFPNSGKLYLEKGNVYWGQKNYETALSLYEKGIEVDPSFPSNYYRATLIYCNSKTEVWGMIYGEIFMNLETNSKRTAEISKLLYDTYKSEIQFKNDTTISVSFCQLATMSINAFDDPGNVKLPFGMMIYEPILMLSTVHEKGIDLNSLDRIRTRFIESYFKNGHDKKYPNVLFEYQYKILKAGHLEAYNHWLLLKGDEEGFEKWKAANEDKWDKFVEWISDNPLKLDSTHKFYSRQY